MGLDPVRAVLRDRLGLVFDGRDDLLEGAVRRAVAATGLDADALLREAASGGPALRELARGVTVGETSFFRHAEQLRAFVALVPELLRAGGEIRVLCAGCSSGEEPATLAMLLDGVPSRISAWDVNPTALERAHRGVYGPWALRDTPPDVRERWFRATPDGMVLDPALRGRIRFEERNLAADEPLAPASLDVVFCRNVLMYLDPVVQRAIVARFARALVPGGALFLGHAETLRGLSDAFETCSSAGAFWYRRTGALAPRLGTAPPAEPPVPADDGWATTIAASSRRLDAVVERVRREPAPVPPPTEPEDTLDQALDALAGGRRDVARALLAPLGDAPAVLLARAVLAAHGDLAEAERLGARLLDGPGLHAEAHHLLALCREAAADPLGAALHDRRALHCDPSFALAHLHLGMMSARAGRAAEARDALGLALVLLDRETAVRIRLFGGGFDRAGLATSARSALGALGSAS